MDNSWGPFYKLQSILADYNWSRCDFPDPSCLRDFVFCALPAALSNTCFLLMSVKLLQIDELSNPQFSFPCACTVSSIPLVAYVWSICFEDFQEQNEKWRYKNVWKKLVSGEKKSLYSSFIQWCVKHCILYWCMQKLSPTARGIWSLQWCQHLM